MSAIWLKFAHIIAIAGWSAGLMCLPYLYAQRRRLTGDALHRLHNFTRFFYVGLVSPAAFVAVATGTVLIFTQAMFEPWFSVKLALVGTLVVVHVMSGLKILRLFEPGGIYPAWRLVAVSLLTSGLVTAILAVVLGKPRWTSDWAGELFTPGALGQMVGDVIAWWK